MIRMLYVLPMILGRTFDISSNKVGVDIFTLEDTLKPRINEESFYRSNFKTVESSSDVKEILEVNGDISLNIKAGKIDLQGVGRYLKSTANSQNSVEILAKVSFRTVSMSLPHSARPLADWTHINHNELGTHYVQNVIYGGDLIACVRFRATKQEYIQEIRATIKGSVSAGSALDLVGGGQLEMLDKKLKNKASMEISYFATVPLEGVPNTIEGLRDLVQGFETHVKKVNNGLGVPVEVELAELSTLDKKFEYIKNLELETELEFFEEYLDDLLTTKSRLRDWLSDLPGDLSHGDEMKVAALSERVSIVLGEFSKTIANLDLQQGSGQLASAKEAYREGKGLGMAGKFQRELNKLIKKVVANLEYPDDLRRVYTHYGSSNCSPLDRATKLIHRGYIASSPRNQIGGGHNYLCMAVEPSSDGQAVFFNKSLLAGVKYGLLESRPKLDVKVDAVALRGAVCSVCVVEKQTVFTFNGQSSCPDGQGWTLQYNGYVMAATDIERSQNVCIDSKLESHQDSYIGQHDQSLNFVAVDQHFVSCAVCSK